MADTTDRPDDLADAEDAADRARPKRVAIRVLIVQALALLGLWLLQSTFS